jgi:hypothetical protein
VSYLILHLNVKAAANTMLFVPSPDRKYDSPAKGKSLMGSKRHDLLMKT